MRYGIRLTEAIREADIEGTYSRGARAGFPRGYTPLWISSKNFCCGLTAPNGGIRSALSIGTVVCSSAVVVGRRSERSVP